MRRGGGADGPGWGKNRLAQTLTLYHICFSQAMLRTIAACFVHCSSSARVNVVNSETLRHLLIPRARQISFNYLHYSLIHTLSRFQSAASRLARKE